MLGMGQEKREARGSSRTEDRKGGTLEEGPRGCRKRLCLTEWVLRAVLLLVPKAPLCHHEGPAAPVCPNLYSRHTSNHCGTWHPIVCHLRKSALPEARFPLAKFAKHGQDSTPSCSPNLSETSHNPSTCLFWISAIPTINTGFLKTKCRTD